MRLRSILGACAAAPLLGLGSAALACPQHVAARIQPGMVTVTPAAFEAQAAQMIVSANAMFRQMSTEMNAIQAQMAAFFQAPMMQAGPEIAAVFGPGMPFGMAPSKGTIISVSITGNGSCSQTITYTNPAHGGRPIVHIAERGNACHAMPMNGAATAPAAQPVPQHVMPHAVAPLDAPPLVQAIYEAPQR